MASTEEQEAKLQRLQLKNRELSMALSIAQLREKKLLRLNDQLYKAKSCSSLSQSAPVAPPEFKGISFVIAAYNIPRQLKRTLASCDPAYQGIPPEQLEVIVVDNGSDVAVRRDELQDFPWVSRVIRVDDHPSPVHALNLGIGAARFPLVAMMIDGAHMLTPGICRLCRSLLSVVSRPVINVPQYMLGEISQAIGSADEDPFVVEERRLNEVDWMNNGYALFDFCTIAGEDVLKCAFEAGESNCLITSQEVLHDCGGFDERFDEAGAGLANIEIFERLTHDPRNEFVIFPGEGSFHQDHHGTTTALSLADRTHRLAEYRRKYEQVTGDKFFASFRNAFYFGPASYKLADPSIISRDYTDARRQVLGELSALYLDRATRGIRGTVPSLSVDPIPPPASVQDGVAPPNTHRATKRSLLARVARRFRTKS